MKVLITKQQLLDASSMREKELFEEGWPEHRKKLNLCEVIRLARELGVGELTINSILWRNDRDGWERAHKPGSLTCKIVTDNYLKDSE